MSNGNHEYRLREAVEEDCALIFRWRNEPAIVALSSSRKMVTWDEHCRWFHRVLADKDVLLLLVEVCDGSTAFGQLRFEVRGVRAEVSIYLMPGWTGKGMGASLLGEGCQRLFAGWPGVEGIDAHIRMENQPSLKVFSKAGFQPSDLPPSHDPDICIYSLARSAGELPPDQS